MDEKLERKSKRGGKRPGSGRKKGVPNKLNALLKDEILSAAGEVGEDGQGEGGLRGYLRMVARTEAKAYSTLIGRVLPLQIAGDKENPLYAVIEQRIVDPKR